MLEACLEIFERQPDIDKLILDTYAPAEGTYVIMAYESGQFVQKEWIEVKKEKKSGAHTNNTQRATNGNKSAHKVTAVYVENKRSAQHFTG